MAIVTRSATCPADIHVTTGGVSYTLNDESPEFHTSDQNVLSNARADTRLEVEEDVYQEAADQGITDPNDPHQNPYADHLSLIAPQEVRDAAAANLAALHAEVGVEHNDYGPSLTTSEAVHQTYELFGLEPHLAFEEPKTQTLDFPIFDLQDDPEPAPSASLSVEPVVEQPLVEVAH